MMSEMITGEQLEASVCDDKYDDDNKERTCQNCGWSGFEDELSRSSVCGSDPLKRSEISVCPKCGSESIEGEI